MMDMVNKLLGRTVDAKEVAENSPKLIDITTRLLAERMKLAAALEKKAEAERALLDAQQVAYLLMQSVDSVRREYDAWIVEKSQLPEPHPITFAGLDRHNREH